MKKVIRLSKADNFFVLLLQPDLHTKTHTILFENRDCDTKQFVQAPLAQFISRDVPFAIFYYYFQIIFTWQDSFDKHIRKSSHDILQLNYHRVLLFRVRKLCFCILRFYTISLYFTRQTFPNCFAISSHAFVKPVFAKT